MKTPGNFTIELFGSRWDGLVMEVPLTAMMVHVHRLTSDLHSVDKPLRDVPARDQFMYDVTPYRCEHGTTMAKYVAAGQE